MKKEMYESLELEVVKFQEEETILMSGTTVPDLDEGNESDPFGE